MSFSMYTSGVTTPLELPTRPLFNTPSVVGQNFNYDLTVGDDDAGSFLNLFGNNDYIGSYNFAPFTNPGTFSITTSGGTDGNAYVDYTLNAPIYNYSPLANNSVVHGTFFAENNTRDTDWYEFTVSDSSDFTLSAVSETSYSIYLIDAAGGCENISAVDSAFGLACDTISMQVTIPAGTYWLLVMPSSFSCLPCSNSIDYLLDVSWLVGCNMVSSVNVTPANCVAPYGSIDLTVSGGTPPYTYIWSNGSVTQDLNNVPVGSYDVMIYDSNNFKGICFSY